MVFGVPRMQARFDAGQQCLVVVSEVDDSSSGGADLGDVEVRPRVVVGGC